MKGSLMLKSDEIVAVLSVITTLVDNDELFTAYDVTRLVRDKLQEHVEHEDVRTLVHALYEGAALPFKEMDYVRNHAVPLQLSGRVDYAEVYAPDSKDAWTQYDPNALTPESLEEMEPLAPVVLDEEDDEFVQKLIEEEEDEELLEEEVEEEEDWGDDEEEDDDDVAVATLQKTTSVVKKPDLEGRIGVPSEYVSGLGLAHGDSVYVAKRNHGQSGLVLLMNPPSTGLLATLTVNSKGSVRVSARDLKAAKLGRKVKISLTNRVVVLTPA